VTDVTAPDAAARHDAHDRRAVLLRLIPITIGALVLIVGTVAGWDGTIVTAIATPPAVVRAGLVAVAVVVGLWFLAGAIARISAAEPGDDGERDLVSLTRGVRLAFLAVAAFSAAAGWLIGHPLPIVVAFIIAGVDVIETSFLLVVVNRRPTDSV
jgi:hypothetical protein